jgi:hypothetical protein
MYDIIPDIHGQSEKLKLALTNLGYEHRNGAWRHSDPNRVCVFLGDFIDRGPNNAEVTDIVRRMVDAGTAFAIMGNHELNAIHFHTNHPTTGAPLRAHSEKNIRQHASFLSEFPFGDKKTTDVLAWMKSLPLYLEFDAFRVVHACWNENIIRKLQITAKAGVLNENQFIEVADKDSELFDLVEVTTKGPEHRLPEGYSITDKDGTIRHDVRLKWWSSNPTSWADVAISVPDLAELPQSPLPREVVIDSYSPDAKPVFFGHYWLSGAPILQAPNALCLDYSAGRDGPVTTYSVDVAMHEFSLDRVVQHRHL